MWTAVFWLRFSFVDMQYKIIDETLIVENFGGFDLEKSCNCGQAFRWTGGVRDERVVFTGVLRSHAVKVTQDRNTLSVFPCRSGEENMFIDYFDLNRDYSVIEQLILNDEKLRVCLPDASGIRVFNQEPFEALISFIISANNNIKRISGIVERLCSLCGEPLELDGTVLFSFPTAERLSSVSEDELKAIGTGYRAPYILDTARRIADGYELEKLRTVGLAEARKQMMSFMGVGPKVADCVLLFSLGHTDAFPIDVWIGRAMKELYFESEQPSKKELESVVSSMGRYSGIIQQYIFYHARKIKLGKQ